MSLAESLGGVETLISHPATMTHASVPPERRAAIGLTDSLVRISAGIEDVADLIDDLKQALGSGGSRTAQRRSPLQLTFAAGDRLIDFVLHFDKHLAEFVQTYGVWVYGVLFAIVFAETGLVVTPFLPGDSLLFAAGALAASTGGGLNPWVLFALLATAAFTGNAVNYAIGRRVGPRIFTATDDSSLMGRMMNRQYLERAHAFFEQYGGKAIVLGRFVPIVRTFVPFVAGAAQMTAASFVFYNAIGAVAWVGLCVLAGVIFGNVPIIKNNFSLVTIVIVLVSMLPVAVEYLRHRSGSRVDSPTQRR